MDWFLSLHIPILIRLNPGLNTYPWADDKTLQVYQKKPIQTSMTILYMHFKPFVGLNFIDCSKTGLIV